eukprot:188713-Rhodomonas_salina.1
MSAPGEWGDSSFAVPDIAQGVRRLIVTSDLGKSTRDPPTSPRALGALVPSGDPPGSTSSSSITKVRQYWRE